MEEPGSEAKNVHLEARVSGAARAYQAAHDIHIHHHDGIAEAHRAEAGGELHDECPYPGLAAFGPEQARWFFGRDQQVSEISIRIAEALDQRPCPLLVTGVSGAGKSSLLRAGLTLALDRGALPAPGSSTWPRSWFTPTEDPLGALATQIADLADMSREAVTDALNGPAAVFADLVWEALGDRWLRTGNAGDHPRIGPGVIPPPGSVTGPAAVRAG